MGHNHEFTLKSSTTEKDVGGGIIFEPDMKFEKYIKEKVNKANQMMSVMRNAFEY